MSQGRKKPVSKKVLALQDQLKRKQGIRELAKRFLIVCEDTKSAPHYFEAFKKYYKLSATSVEILGSGYRSQPLQVVQRALERQKEARSSNSGTVPFAEAWCVVDGDYGSKVDVARNAINDQTTFLAVSTPCFEYWILLHLEENSTPADSCSDVISALRGLLSNSYDKGSFAFEELIDHASTAASRSETSGAAQVGRPASGESQSM